MTSYGNSIGGRRLRRCDCNGQIKSARAISVFERDNEDIEEEVRSNLPAGVRYEKLIYCSGQRIRAQHVW